MDIEITVEQITQESERVETQFDSEGACKIIVLGGANLGAQVDFNALGIPFNIPAIFTLDSGDPKDELNFTGVISLTPNNPLTKNKKITILRFTETP